jgi:OPA family glycerol-3-phosphate transporter-like MFS transporter 3
MSETNSIPVPTPEKSGISFWEAWLIPGVFIYAVSYGCVKLVNDGLFMWLPFYIREGLERTTSD